MLTIHHDEDAEVYHQRRACRKRCQGHTRHYRPLLLDDESPQAAAASGENTIAVHCHQTTGGQYIDLGLADIVEQ